MIDQRLVFLVQEVMHLLTHPTIVEPVARAATEYGLAYSGIRSLEFLHAIFVSLRGDPHKHEIILSCYLIAAEEAG
jgi:hypothetical protein